MNTKHITIHCSASKPSVAKNETAATIRAMHKAKGWRDVGYHYVIRRDGATEKGRLDSVIGAHVKGHNNNNLGICLSGGVDENNKPEQNYTDAQYHALYALIVDLCDKYDIPHQEVYGHRDWPDVAKACPCFNVKEWLAEQLKINLNNKDGL